MSTGPKISDGHYSVLLAEVETGILLSAPGVRSKGGTPTFHTFETREAATAFADGVIQQNSDIECIVFDSGGCLIEEKRDLERLLLTRASPNKAPGGFLRRLFARSGRKPQVPESDE